LSLSEDSREKMAATAPTNAERLLSLLTKYDRSGAGVLTADQLMLLLKTCAKGSLSDVQLKAMVEAVDPKNEGQIAMTQVVRWMFKSFEEKIDDMKTDAELQNMRSTIPAGLSRLSLCFHFPDQFTDEGLSYIGAGIPATLRELAVSFQFSWTEFKISTIGLAWLCSGIPKGLKLLELGFKNDEFTDEALVELAASMPKSLTSLRLIFKDNADFTDEGFCKLIAGLPGSLEEVVLDFDSNPNFTDASLDALASWLKSSGSNITHLYVTNNGSSKYSEAGLRRLCIALPQGLRAIKLEFNSSPGDLANQFKVGPDDTVQFVGKKP